MRQALDKATRRLRPIVLCSIALAVSHPVRAQQSPPSTAELTYADLADLTDSSSMVLKVQVKSQAKVPAERAADVKPGWARIYMEAKVLALLAGRAPVGEMVRYLADVPLNEKGKVPKFSKAQLLLFARAVPGRPGELQLAGPRGQLRADPVLEGRIRPILADFYADGAVPAVLGVKDALWVPGNLAGESETQIFLRTRGDEPAQLSVLRRPGMEPRWGVSWSELVDQSGEPPAKDSLAWYRLACFLPARIPSAAHISRDQSARARAEEDFQLVRASLVPCPRTPL